MATRVFWPGYYDHPRAAARTGFTFRHGELTSGFFALALHADHGGNGRNYAPTSKDYLGIVQRNIEQLETGGADLIIGLTHLHMSTDVEIAKLKKDHPAFTFVVGSHAHEHSAPSATAVMKGAWNARAIWQIDVTFDARGVPSMNATMHTLDESVAVDPDYAKLEQKWHDRLLEIFPFLKARIGAAAFPLDATEANIRNNETSWGNFIVDQMRTAFGEPAADFAFINSGTLRIDDYIADDILFEDIGRTFGFSSYLRHRPVAEKSV